MKRNFLLLIFPILFLFSVIPVYADWTQVSKSGDWSVCERTHWEQTDIEDSQGVASWQTTIENFTGYYAKIDIYEIATYKLAWWHFAYWKYLYLTWDFTSDLSNTITVTIRIGAQASWWGLLYGTSVLVSEIKWNGESFGEINPGKEGVYPPRFVEFYLWADKENSTVTGKVYFWIPENSNPYLLGSFEHEITSDEFYNSTLIDFQVRHEGSGIFNAEMKDTIKTQGEWGYTFPTPIEETPAFNQIWNNFWYTVGEWFGKALPGWAQNFIATLRGYADFFISLIVLIGQSALQFFPFFPLIFLFWLLDAIITSVAEGNLQPVGNAVMTIYNTLRGIVGVIANIAETLWSIIKFW